MQFNVKSQFPTISELHLYMSDLPPVNIARCFNFFFGDKGVCVNSVGKNFNVLVLNWIPTDFPNGRFDSWYSVAKYDNLVDAKKLYYRLCTDLLTKVYINL